MRWTDARAKKAQKNFPRARIPDVIHCRQGDEYEFAFFFFAFLTNAAIEKEGGGGYRVSKRGVLFVRSLYGENMNFNTNRVFVPFLPYRGHSRAKQSVNYPATELICEGWSRAWMQGRVGRDYLELKSARESLCTYYLYTAARASAIGQRDRN